MKPVSLGTTTTVVLVSLVAGCGGEGEAPSQGRGGPPARPPTPVEVYVATTDTVTETVLATGAVEAIQSIELRPEMQGRLVEIMAREGREVRRGTPLFKIDDAELRALVAQLEAERDQAVQALQRTRELLDMDASSQADLESAEASARSREAQLELQRVRLERTTVRAYVTTSTRLTTLQTVDPQRVAFQVPERYAERLARDQQVRFTVAAVAREFVGTVDFVDPVVQVPGRTILIKARVPNPDRALRPGMFVEARLATEVRPEAIVIPEDAILPLGNQSFAWVVADGTATRREVTLGVRTPGFVEITQGVDEGEQVVVGGLQRLLRGTTPSDSATADTASG